MSQPQDINELPSLEIFGEPGDFGASYEDDGTHEQAHLEPCPFCGSHELTVNNTHTACYWVSCHGCDAQVNGDSHVSNIPPQTRHEVIEQHLAAFKSAVTKWNRRTNRS